MDFAEHDLRMLAKRLARDVRARLDAAGHDDVAFDEHWVDFTPTGKGGHELSVLVPLGASLSLPLQALEGRAADDPDALMKRFATDLASALPNVRAAASMLTRHFATIRRAALREVEAAREAGLDIQLERVSPKPTCASSMTQPSWRDAARHVLAVVGVRRLDFALRPEIDEFIVGEAEDVAAEMVERREEQTVRQARRTELRTRGADLEVDEATMRILEHFGLDAADLLRRADTDQVVHITVDEDGRPGRLSLVSSNGRVGATLGIEGRLRWVDGCFVIERTDAQQEHLPKAGHLLLPSAGLPFLRGLLVTEVEAHPDALATLVHVHAPTLLFDGVTGRAWAEERLAA